MSLLESKIDYEFVAHIGNISRELGAIATELKVSNQAKQVTDEQVKEIIKSYPKEDLYNLLNYDQKRYILEAEKKESISDDARDKLLENYSSRVENCTDDELDSIAKYVAYLWVEECKDDSNLDYWTNINNLLEKALEREGR